MEIITTKGANKRTGEIVKDSFSPLAMTSTLDKSALAPLYLRDKNPKIKSVKP